MGFLSNLFKDIEEFLQEDPVPYEERDLNEIMNNDIGEEVTLLYEDAFENDYDTEEMKRIKQSLFSTGCKDLNRAYEIAEKKKKLKETNLKKYYNK